MPNGIYLNAIDLGPKKLANMMNEIIRNKTKFYDFFKWHNHYSFHDPSESNDTDVMCELCSFLNEKSRKNELHFYETITSWWNMYNFSYTEPEVITFNILNDFINDWVSVFSDIF